MYTLAKFTENELGDRLMFKLHAQKEGPVGADISACAEIHQRLLLVGDGARQESRDMYTTD